MTLEDVKRRDALLEGCVKKLKMTAQQIADFSRCWQFPFHDQDEVWRRLLATKLDRKVRHKARQSLHDRWTLDVFIKLARDAIRNGFPVGEIAKEHSIGENSGIRADLRFRIRQPQKNREFLFYLETQRTHLLYQSMRAKLTKYLHHRKKSRPFRVLIVMEDEASLNTTLRYVREVLAPHPDLTLFLLAWLPDLLGQYDAVTEDVWTDHRHRPVALL